MSRNHPSFTREITVVPTAEEMARLFAHSDHDEQAEILDLIAEQFAEFKGGEGAQLVWVNESMTPRARKFVRLMHEYLGVDENGGA